VNAESLQKWADVITLMFTHGLTTYSQIAGIIKAARGTAPTDEELNAIIKQVQDDARARKARSDEEVAKAQALIDAASGANPTE